ncbi:MAG: hypothetical protein ACLRIS_02465 [Flavonifractor plautii]
MLGVERAAEQAALLVVVTNELFSDGMDYDPETWPTWTCWPG